MSLSVSGIFRYFCNNSDLHFIWDITIVRFWPYFTRLSLHTNLPWSSCRRYEKEESKRFKMYSFSILPFVEDSKINKDSSDTYSLRSKLVLTFSSFVSPRSYLFVSPSYITHIEQRLCLSYLWTVDYLFSSVKN